MRKAICFLKNHGQGMALGALLALSSATPVAAAPLSPTAPVVLKNLLPIGIIIGLVLYSVGMIRERNISGLFKGVAVGLMGFVISLFLVDIL